MGQWSGKLGKSDKFGREGDYLMSRPVCTACSRVWLSLDDLLHRGHVAAQFLAHDFNRMRTNCLVHCDEFGIIYAVIGQLQAFPDDIGIDFFHELFQKRHTFMREKIAAILRGIGNHIVHFVELFPANQVGNQRNLMQ